MKILRRDQEVAAASKHLAASDRSVSILERGAERGSGASPGCGIFILSPCVLSFTQAAQSSKYRARP